MTRAIGLALLFLSRAVPAAAQTEGRISVGGTVTYVETTDGEVGALVGYGPRVRLNPRKGWAPTSSTATSQGRNNRDRWKADAIVVGVGAVYSLF